MSEPVNTDFAEQVYGAILSIQEALRQINEEENYEISESLKEISDSLEYLNGYF